MIRRKSMDCGVLTAGTLPFWRKIAFFVVVVVGGGGLIIH